MSREIRKVPSRPALEQPWPEWAQRCAAGRAVFPPAAVGLAGSRYLPESAESLVRRVVRGAVAAGRPLAAGCAVGADAYALRAAVSLRAAESLTIFAAFGPYGLGAWRDSAVGAVVNAAAAGAAVRWWAGGGEAGRPARTAGGAHLCACVVSRLPAGLVAGGVPGQAGGALAAPGWRCAWPWAAGCGWSSIRSASPQARCRPPAAAVSGRRCPSAVYPAA